jgi:hypothetical protein
MPAAAWHRAADRQPAAAVLTQSAVGTAQQRCALLPQPLTSRVCVPRRNKLTKLQQTERRQLNTELKGLVQEQLSTKQAKGSTGKQQQQPEAQAAAAAAAPVDMMAE